MKIELPNDPKLASRVIDAEAQHTSKRMERGWMGAVFGSSHEKPGNIAGFTIILACAMIIIVGYMPAATEFPKRELLMLFGSVITGALGFVFGRESGKSD